MDVLLNNVVAGKPAPVHPIANHGFHIRPFLLLRRIPQLALVPAGGGSNDLADGAMRNAIVSFLIRAVMPPLSSRHDAQVVGRGFLAGRQHGTHSGGIDGARLLQKTVLLSVNGSIEMQRPEMRRRGAQNQIHVGREHFLISVKADKAMVIGNLLLPLLGKLGAAFIQMVLENVPQRHDLKVGACLEEVQGSAGAPLAATDQARLQYRSVRGHIHEGHGRVGLLATGQHRAGAHRRYGADKRSAIKIPFLLLRFLLGHFESPLK